MNVWHLLTLQLLDKLHINVEQPTLDVQYSISRLECYSQKGMTAKYASSTVTYLKLYCGCKIFKASNVITRKDFWITKGMKWDIQYFLKYCGELLKRNSWGGAESLAECLTLWERGLSILPRARWEDWFHSLICALCMELEPGGD